MNKFMVVATFQPNVEWDDITALVAQEQVAAKLLQDEGLLTALRISVARDKVFLEVTAEDRGGAEALVHRLPLAKWWDLEVYQLAPPVL